MPWECREYDREASLHFAVSYLSAGLWWCVHPHTPVVWWVQWCAVLVDGSDAADAVGALRHLRLLLRADRHQQRTDHRQPPRPRAAEEGRTGGEVGGALRRHHPDLPGQPAPFRRRRPGERLPLRGHRRGEQRRRLQPRLPLRQPLQRARLSEDQPAAHQTPDLPPRRPGRGHYLLRPPLPPPQRAGVRQEEHRLRLPRLPDHQGRPDQVRRPGLPHPPGPALRTSPPATASPASGCQAHSASPPTTS